LLAEVINKTNNIPVPFDLYITTNTEEKKNYISTYLLKNTKANKYEILITQNKGRDVIPFLIQLKDVWNNYK
jgi:lipopolysaccharide biosynthesis protein